MYMTEREIIGKYKRGVKVKILAELNAVPVTNIEQILQSATDLGGLISQKKAA